MQNTSQTSSRHPLINGCILLAVTFGLSTAVFGQAFYENRFNDENGLEFKNGAALGPDASGVSGKPGDKCYTADAKTLVADQHGPSASITANAGAFEGDEVTITLWYKPNSEILDAATLLRAFAGQLMWEGRKEEWVMRLDAGPEDPTKKNANWLFSGKFNGMNMPGDWNFIAFVWKKDGNFSEFFLGNRTETAVSGRKGNHGDLLGSIGERDPENRVVGNESGGKMLRFFDGSIDNLRVFKKALDAEAIEKIRMADAENTAVTLP